MALFLQLDLATTPRLHPDLSIGLLQAFFCIDFEPCWYGESAGDLFASNHLFRIIDAGTPGRPATAPSGTPAATLIPRKMISGWDHFDDFPSTADGEHRFGLHWGEFTDQGENVICENPPLILPATFDDWLDEFPQARGGEKLGGWAAWANIYIDYPQCPECEQVMDLMLFQFGHSGNVPIMFGDGGTGDIVCCQKHPKNMAYVWSCG